MTTKDVINPTLSAGVDLSGNQKLTFNISNKVTAEFSSKDWDGVGSAPSESATQSQTDLSYLNSLKDQISSDNLTLQPIYLIPGTVYQLNPHLEIIIILSPELSLLEIISVLSPELVPSPQN